MYKKYEDELKARQRSFVEMQSKFAKSEKENGELRLKLEKTELEKRKVTEKWIRASHRPQKSGTRASSHCEYDDGEECRIYSLKSSPKLHLPRSLQSSEFKGTESLTLPFSETRSRPLS